MTPNKLAVVVDVLQGWQASRRSLQANETLDPTAGSTTPAQDSPEQTKVQDARANPAANFIQCVSNRSQAPSPPQVIIRGDYMYPSYNVRNFQAGYHHRHPLAFGLPWGEQDVAVLIVCANANGLPFTARSGGHSYEGV